MRKVCLLGTAPLSKEIAPFDDASWEIWGCSAGNMNLKRVTLWFELHANVEIEARENQVWAGPYFKWLREQTFPVYLLESNDALPQARIFPGKTLIQEFGREWFTSSIAWMMALAIYEKVDEIAIFGVDMAAELEHYSGQRTGCRAFIEIARQRGIKTTIPWESCLGMPPPLYGYSEATPQGRRLNVMEAQCAAKHAELKAQIERLVMERVYFEGAIEQLRYFKRTFLDGADAFEHMAPDIEASARAAVDKAVVATPSFSTLSQESVEQIMAKSKLTPPPDDLPAGKPNGSGDGRGLSHHPAARLSHRRPVTGQRKDV